MSGPSTKTAYACNFITNYTRTDKETFLSYLSICVPSLIRFDTELILICFNFYVRSCTFLCQIKQTFDNFDPLGFFPMLLFSKND